MGFAAAAANDADFDAGAMLTSCFVCRENYTTADDSMRLPKLLPCCHTVCESCVGQIIDENTHLVCPVDERQFGEITSSQMLANNALSMEKAAAVEVQAAAVGGAAMCEVCEDEDQQEATHRCVDCPTWLCESHRRAHLRIRGTANHAVAAVGELAQGAAAAVTKPMMCPSHNKNEISLFCETCDRTICHVCAALSAHDGHVRKDIGEGVEKHKDEIKPHIEKAAALIEPLHHAHDLVRIRLAEVAELEARLLERIGAHEAAMIAHVRETSDQARTDLRRKCSEYEQELEQQAAALDAGHKSALHMRDLSAQTLGSSNAAIVSMKKALVEELRSLHERRWTLEPAAKHIDVQIHEQQTQAAAAAIRSSISVFSGAAAPAIRGRKRREADAKELSALQYERALSGNGTAGAADGQFSYPYGIAIDANGNIYVVDYSNHRIQVISDDGRVVRKFGSAGAGDGQLSGPIGIAIDNDGNIVVADYSNNRVKVFSPEGQFIRKFGTAGAGAGQLQYPYHLCISKTSTNIYVAEWSNQRVQEFTAEGNHVRFVGVGQLANTVSVDVDADDNIYVGDVSHRVLVFNKQGALIRTIGSSGAGAGQLQGPYSIHVDEHSGCVIVGDDNGVQVFQKNGTFVRKLPGPVTGAYGLDMDSRGRIVAASYTGHTVHRFG